MFRELFSAYEKDGKGALINAPNLPICKTCGKNIFNDIEHMEYERSGNGITKTNVYQNLPYYKTWLLETDTFADLLCYTHYNTNISITYEPSKRQELLLKDSSQGVFKWFESFNLPKRFYGRLFANRQNIQQQDKMIEVAKEYVAGGYKGTYLMASVQRGFGKTDIACCLAMQYWIDKGSSGHKSFWRGSYSMLNSDILFLHENDIYFLIRSTYSKDAEYTEFDIYEQITERTKFLVLDDIFFLGDKEFIKSVISRIIHKRCDENMLPLVVTSNAILSTMSGLDKSLTSRLSRGRYVSVDPKQQAIDLRKEL